MMVKVRNAEEKDVQAILDIINYEILNSSSVYDYTPKTVEEQMNWFHQRKMEGFPVLVAELQGEVVGYGSYGTFRQKAGYRFCVEHSIYVSSSARGKGVGQELMRELIEIAKRNRIHTMIAGIDAQNSGSIRFHEQFGFIEVGTFKEVGRKFDQWLDVTFMQLTFDSNR